MDCGVAWRGNDPAAYKNPLRVLVCALPRPRWPLHDTCRTPARRSKCRAYRAPLRAYCVERLGRSWVAYLSRRPSLVACCRWVHRATQRARTPAPRARHAPSARLGREPHNWRASRAALTTRTPTADATPQYQWRARPANWCALLDLRVHAQTARPSVFKRPWATW